MLYHCMYLETSMDSGLCAISPKHRCRTSYDAYDARARAPSARAREGDRARYHSVTQLKAGAFQMFHRVYHVTTKAHSTQDCPEPPKGLLIVPRRAWSFFWAFWCNSATRREALCAPPWAVWDDPRLSGYLHGALRTLIVQDYDKRGPQSPNSILTDF